jgi:hypothetical protein
VTDGRSFATRRSTQSRPLNDRTSERLPESAKETLISSAAPLLAGSGTGTAEVEAVVDYHRDRGWSVEPKGVEEGFVGRRRYRLSRAGDVRDVTLMEAAGMATITLELSGDGPGAFWRQRR